MGGIVSAADAKRIRGALINRITSRVTETDVCDTRRGGSGCRRPSERVKTRYLGDVTSLRRETNGT